MHNVGAEIAALEHMTTGELARRYSELHGQPCRTRHRAYLIRKIAWKKAMKTKSKAERIASSRAEGRIERRFDGQAGEMLDEANGSFSGKFQNPLLRRDSFPNALNFRTSDRFLFVELMRAGSFQLAPAGQPPELNGDHDVAVRVHESVVGNFSETLIGSETLTDVKLIELLEQAEVEIPEELQIGPDKDPWSITFARELPVRVSFADDGVTITIEGRQFTRSEQKIRAPIRISAKYTLQITEEGPRITRQGDVAVEYVGREKLSVQQITMKTFLRKKFDSLFKPELAGEGLVLPGRWDRAGKLKVRQLDSGGGWLALGWGQEPSDAQPATEQVAATE